MSTPQITVNGEPQEFGGTVAELLEQRLGDARPTGIAVAVGEDVVRRDAWATHVLAAGDEVEIVMAVQGG
ncbi:sulfur carrier protein ThiS [Nocardioides panacisoli]|uniref:sulfur carrier protein ThiS n=1 Tax=Nocardioides panacisoli TaxID=627624 RepID=UPI001C62C812|nr:sulfur carrier protein ThiS [Nocardioides panacisoli]QYJ02641.1 sulfur carrier protein ThiS [Nocardioides panacisoli]